MEKLYKTTAKPLLSKICPVCKSTFTPRCINTQVYCSEKCKNNGRGMFKNNMYGILGYTVYRNLILDRDNHKCTICVMESSKLLVHHVKPIDEGGTNLPSNLTSVCTDCHKKLHREIRKIKQKLTQTQVNAIN